MADINDSTRRSFYKLKRLFKGSRNSSRTSLNASSSSLGSENDSMPPLRAVKFHGYAPTTKNRIITQRAAEDIRNMLPTRLKINHDWNLLYSLEQHGASLNSLYRNLKQSRDKKTYDKNGYVLVIKDATGNIFGSFTNEIFQPHELKRYYGNGECFLWTTEKIATKDDPESIRFIAFPYTGVNDYCIYCQYDSISIGSSEGHNGIWIDGDLVKGVTQKCDTFGNDVLSKQGERFKIMGLEVWMV